MSDFNKKMLSKLFVIIKTFEFLKNCAPIQLLKNYNLLDGAQASNGATFHIVGNEIDSCIEFCKWNNGTTMQVEQCTARCLKEKTFSSLKCHQLAVMWNTVSSKVL